MAPEELSLDGVFDTISLQHLQQLQDVTLKNLPHIPVSWPYLPYTSTSDLMKWTQESMQEISAGVANRVYGGRLGSEINFNNALTAFMESSVMYLRNASLVVKAVETFRDGQVEEAIRLLRSSTQAIDEIAALWGMKFIQICDLVEEHPNGRPYFVGPFCGAFIPKNFRNSSNPFIGVAFKGTNVTREVINDIWAAVTTRVPQKHLWGAQVSEGFYFPLFSPYVATHNRVPQDMIRDTVNRLAKMCDGGYNSIPLHITGHSLGGAYASLCYGQFAFMQNDLDARLFLGDLYTFGSPRVARGDFARPLRQAMTAHQLGSSWRIVNYNIFWRFAFMDIVARYPCSPHGEKNPFIHIDTVYQIYRNRPPKRGRTEIGTHPPFIPLSFSLVAHYTNAYYESLKYAITRVARVSNHNADLEVAMAELGGEEYFRFAGSLFSEPTVGSIDTRKGGLDVKTTSGTLFLQSAGECTIGIICLGPLVGQISAWGNAASIGEVDVSLGCTSLKDLYGRHTQFSTNISASNQLQILFVDGDSTLAVADININSQLSNISIKGTCIWGLSDSALEDYSNILLHEIPNASVSESALEKIIDDSQYNLEE